ncbi:MAG: thioredoxin TrxA [Sphingomonadaceae bacterium]|uniref:thioredoxin TrxA n=1 Tax=Thermaurantiacus sp. TaxID=2820283 RepID=UPI00298ED34D|nr:thioredoxin TrxA [Thermaurantiacus sp.]MCS6986415.1 thioredoxin TrxA [Sphingomonadaceae bacterium]MDW8414324.1 thioredoxin TrxA [Thermaurantiacus sp.]
MATRSVTDATFDDEVLKAEGPVLVDFWAEWCGPCRMIAPALDELSEELAGRVTIAKLNIDEAPETAMRFGIRSIPTMMLFRGGEVVATKLGAEPKAALRRWIEGALEG